MTTRLIVFCLLIVLSSSSVDGLQHEVTLSDKEATTSATAAKSDHVTLQSDDKRVTVMLDDELFTSFDYTSFDKPILYPIYAPGQQRHFC